MALRSSTKANQRSLEEHVAYSSADAASQGAEFSFILDQLVAVFTVGQQAADRIKAGGAA